MLYTYKSMTVACLIGMDVDSSLTLNMDEHTMRFCTFFPVLYIFCSHAFRTQIFICLDIYMMLQITTCSVNISFCTGPQKRMQFGCVHCGRNPIFEQQQQHFL